MVQAVVQTTVTGLQGNPVAATVPAANQALVWNGTSWAPAGPYLPLIGVTNGSNAAAGQVGEYIETVVSTGVPVATSGWTTYAATTLSPGDWDIGANIGLGPVSGSNNIGGGITNTVNGTPQTPAYFALSGPTFGACNVSVQSRVSISTSQTFYIAAAIAGGASGNTATGVFWARRAR
jgi:hypothetical protein